MISSKDNPTLLEKLVLALEYHRERGQGFKDALKRAKVASIIIVDTMGAEGEKAGPITLSQYLVDAVAHLFEKHRRHSKYEFDAITYAHEILKLFREAKAEH